jgi:nitroreductase
MVSDEQMMSLFEAARWAPSSFNAQLWRFVYAKRGTPYFQKFFDLLVPFNQLWTKNASFLVLIISRKKFTYNDQPSRTHSFDAGAAWENLALEGSMQGLVVHAMEGFNYDKAREVCAIPDDYSIEAMIAIGKQGLITDLPEELREREFPSDREPLQTFLFEGIFRQ